MSAWQWILNASAMKFINMFSLIFCFLYCWAPYVAVNSIYIEDVTGKCNSAFSLVLFNSIEKYTKEKTALSCMCHCQYYTHTYIYIYIYIKHCDGNTTFNSLLCCSLCSHHLSLSAIWNTHSSSCTVPDIFVHF